MEQLYGWWFTYNPFTSQWNAAAGEDRNEIGNNYKSEKVIKSKDINTLIDLIIRTEGKIEEMNKLMHDSKN